MWTLFVTAKLRCLQLTFSSVILVRGVGASCPGWFVLAPAQVSGQTVSSVNSYCTMILEYLVVSDVNIISVKLRCLHLTFSWVILVRGVWGKLSRLVYLAPRPGFESGIVISRFLLHHNLGIFSCKSCEHYFSQTEMFTSNVQFGYPCPRGGGGWAGAGASCPGWFIEILGGGGKINRPAQLALTPCQYITKLNIWSKHLRLTEIKFISFSTNYSCSGWCNKNCWLSIRFEIPGGGGGKINCPGQLAPHPLSIRNPTEHLK